MALRVLAAAGALALLAGLELTWFSPDGRPSVDAFENYRRTDLLLAAAAGAALVAALLLRHRLARWALLAAGLGAGAVVLKVVADDAPDHGAKVALAGTVVIAGAGLAAVLEGRRLSAPRIAPVAAAAAIVLFSLALFALPLVEEGRAALIGAAVLLGASALPRVRWRAAATVVVLGALLAGMLTVSYDEPNAMGDYANFVQSREAFEIYAGNALPFQYQLGGTILREADQALGADQASTEEAFDVLAQIVGGLLVLSLLALALLERFSPRVLRYLALVAAIPIMTLFSGYHEYGHLPLSLVAAGVPLVLIGLERHRFGHVVAGAAVLGVGAALHGLGLTALGFMVALLLLQFARDPWLRREPGFLKGTWQAGTAAVTGWLIWVPVNVIFFSAGIDPGHADERPLRPLFDAEYVGLYYRTVDPVFSRDGLEAIGMELLVLGGAVTLVMLAAMRDRLSRTVAWATIPAFLFTVMYWPVQGLGTDTDSFAMAFPAAFGAAWLVSRSPRLCVVALLLLVAGHVGLEEILNNEAWVHGAEDRRPAP